jgi:hypothetical protein
MLPAYRFGALPMKKDNADRKVRAEASGPMEDGGNGADRRP